MHKYMQCSLDLVHMYICSLFKIWEWPGIIYRMHNPLTIIVSVEGHMKVGVKISWILWWLWSNIQKQWRVYNNTVRKHEQCHDIVKASSYTTVALYKKKKKKNYVQQQLVMSVRTFHCDSCWSFRAWANHLCWARPPLHHGFGRASCRGSRTFLVQCGAGASHGYSPSSVLWYWDLPQWSFHLVTTLRL